MNAWSERVRGLVLRFQDWLRAGVWCALLEGLALRGLGCGSSSMTTTQTVSSGPISAVPAGSGGSAETGAVVLFQGDFDVALGGGGLPSCARMVTAACPVARAW